MRKEWTLFLTFLKIGAFTFGGGYGMVSLVRENSHFKRLANGKRILKFHCRFGIDTRSACSGS